MQQNSPFVQNLLWFLASLGLAFFVWLIATTQADPIQEKSFSNIPIQSLTPGNGLIVTNTTAVRRPVRVFVQARKSVLDLLTGDDLTVTADLSGLGPGTHQVELHANVARGPSAADTQPAQVTVILEQEISQQKPVHAGIVNEPPAGYSVSGIDFSETQILVRGVASRVEQVVAVEAQIDLLDQRNSLDQEFPLRAVDAEGNIIEDVTIAQPVVRATVNIEQSANVRVISVQPDIDVNTLPDGYIIQFLDYTPKNISFRGSQESLNTLPESIETITIDLSNRTDDFEVSVPLDLQDLPDDVIVEGTQLINVEVTIESRETSRQFDNVTVEFIGLNPLYTARAIPSSVNVLVTGPQPVVEALVKSDIRVVVDLDNLAPGTYDLLPLANISGGQIAAENISVLPTQITVIINGEATPEATPDGD